MARLLTFIIDRGGLPVVINRTDYDEKVDVLHVSQSLSEVNAFIEARNSTELSPFVFFTPRLQDDTFSDAEGQAYAVQDGKATKIGSFVFFEFRIKTTSLGTLTGTSAVNIVGFPFPIVGDTSIAYNGQALGLNLPGTFAVTGRFDSATQSMRVMMMNAGAGHSSVQTLEFSSDGELKMSGHYQTSP